MVTEKNPHLVPHGNSWKFKRANLAVTRPNMQLQCYQNCLEKIANRLSLSREVSLRGGAYHLTGLRSRNALGGVGFLTTLGVGVGLFCPTPDVQLYCFYITLLSWEFLLKWYNFFWNICWNRFLAVYHDFHWF